MANYLDIHVTQTLISEIGFEFAGSFLIWDTCPSALYKILEKLDADEEPEFEVRNLLLAKEFLQTTLKPLVLSLNDSDVSNKKEIYSLALRVICNITQPTRCIISSNTKMCQMAEWNMKKHLEIMLESFLDESFMKIILDKIPTLDGDKLEFHEEDAELINQSMFLFRNLLYIDENSTSTNRLKDKICLNIWCNGFKSIMMSILESHELIMFCVPIVQLLKLMFKDDIFVKKNEDYNSCVENLKCLNGSCSEFDYPSSEEEMEVESYSSGPLQKKMFMAETNESVQNEIREYLLAFCMEFLQSGLANLIKSIRLHILTVKDEKLSDIYLMWMLEYFLKLAINVKIPVKDIRGCISLDIMGYLSYSAINSYEKFYKSTSPAVQNSEKIRHHLVIRAILAVMDCVSMMEKQGIVFEDASLLQVLKTSFVHCCNFEKMFPYLLKKCDINTQVIDYLGDLIVANHKFLVIANEIPAHGSSLNDNQNMLNQIEKYANEAIMSKYGFLLENFSENSAELNDFILTMMHHVAGSCEKPDSIFEFSILATLIEILESDYVLKPEFLDLINFILEQFSNMTKHNPNEYIDLINKNLMVELETNTQKIITNDLWSTEEVDILYEHMLKDISKDELIQVVKNDLCSKGFSRNPREILMFLESLERNSAPDMELNNSCNIEKFVSFLHGKNMSDALSWMQDVLLETVYIKIGGREVGKRWIPEDPVCLHYILLEESVPLIPYTQLQETYLQEEAFLILLCNMDFQMSLSSTKNWPRIPQNWSVCTLMKKAELLGKIDYSRLKFSEEDYLSCKSSFQTEITPKPTSICKTKKKYMYKLLWMKYVEKSLCSEVDESYRPAKRIRLC